MSAISASPPRGFLPFPGCWKAPDVEGFFWAALEPIGRPDRGWGPLGALIFYAYWWKIEARRAGKSLGQLIPTAARPCSAAGELGMHRMANQGEYCGAGGRRTRLLDRQPDFRNINWRSTDSLKINRVQLSLYLEPDAYERSGGGTTRTVWYDDVVVATKYIGPKVQRTATRGATAPVPDGR